MNATNPKVVPSSMSTTLKAMVVGFSADAMRVLTHELRLAGHHVLGAVGKQGAWTFLRAAPWDLVLVPLGPDGERARGWVDELALGIAVLPVPEGAEALVWLGRFMRGEPAKPPPLPEPPAPEPPAPEPAGLELRRPEPAEVDAESSEETALPTASPIPAEVSADSASPVSGQTRRRKRPDARSDAWQSGEPESRDPHPDLVSKLAQVRFGDYHSILEVEPNASPYAVREQRERLGHRFSPRGWPARLTPEEIDMLNEIGRAIADAHLILGDPELAARYERALSQGGSRLVPETPAMGYASDAYDPRRSHR